MTLKLKRTYRYSSEYYRADFTDGTGFLYTKAQLNRFNLIINYVKKIDRMGIKQRKKEEDKACGLGNSSIPHRTKSPVYP